MESQQLTIAASRFFLLLFRRLQAGCEA